MLAHYAHSLRSYAHPEISAFGDLQTFRARGQSSTKDCNKNTVCFVCRPLNDQLPKYKYHILLLHLLVFAIFLSRAVNSYQYFGFGVSITSLIYLLRLLRIKMCLRNYKKIAVLNVFQNSVIVISGPLTMGFS